MQVEKLVKDKLLSPVLIAEELRTTKGELAATLGLAKDAFTRSARVRAPRSQTRLRQMIEIMNRIEPEIDSPIAAYAWFRSARLPGFGGATPHMLVREGRGEQVHAYLDRIVVGGYA